MKAIRILILALLATCFKGWAQQGVPLIKELGQLKPDTTFENLLVRKLGGDSLTTTYVIWIRKSVALHYHKNHSEQVIILEGKGTMKLGNETRQVSTGDWIFIPKGTAHSVEVTSSIPMKVLSVQAPLFDGTDRIPVAKP